MKSWKTLLGLSLGSLALVACTISTGDSDDDDDPFTIDPGKEPSDDDVEPDAGKTEPPATDDDSDDDVEPDAGKTVVEPGPVGDPNFMCNVAAQDDCEACMANLCCDERTDCAANGTCADEWTAIKSCMDTKDLMSNPSDDNQAEVEDCMSQSAPGSNLIDLSDEVFNLLECVARDYEEMAADAGADDSDLIEGDDLCTLACYGVFSTNPVAVE